MPFNPSKIIYWKNGLPYRKLKRNETIETGAMQSWCHGELSPIADTDGETVGDKPSSFSDERDFYNPLHPEQYGWYKFLDNKNVYYIPEAIRALRTGFFMLEDTEDIYLVTGVAQDVLPCMLTTEKWNGAPIDTSDIPMALIVQKKSS